ncbi:MAG: GDYXXLXY domain-containing protein [Planctomycetales bacterium]
MLELTSNTDDSKWVGPDWIEGGIARVSQFHWQLLSAAIVFHFAVLVGMILTNAAPLVWGDALLVRVVPVDPRSLFRGDYVILSYEFSRPGQIDGLQEEEVWPHGSEVGRTVYVSLVPEADERHWKAGKYSLRRPASGKFLRGQITAGGRLQFGIESYFVQEGEGRRIEKAIRSQQVSAEIVVTSSGKAALRRLVME